MIVGGSGGPSLAGPPWNCSTYRTIILGTLWVQVFVIAVITFFAFRYWTILPPFLWISGVAPWSSMSVWITTVILQKRSRSLLMIVGGSGGPSLAGPPWNCSTDTTIILGTLRIQIFVIAVITVFPTLNISRHYVLHGHSSSFGCFRPANFSGGLVGPKCAISWETEFSTGLLVLHLSSGAFFIASVVNVFLYHAPVWNANSMSFVEVQIVRRVSKVHLYDKIATSLFLPSRPRLDLNLLSSHGGSLKTA